MRISAKPTRREQEGKRRERERQKRRGRPRETESEHARKENAALTKRARGRLVLQTSSETRPAARSRALPPLKSFRKNCEILLVQSLQRRLFRQRFSSSIFGGGNARLREVKVERAP